VLNSGAVEGIALAASEASLPPAGRSVAHGQGHGQHSAAKAGTVSREELEKLREDLSLKEADNHFLQEELEQKDRMLSMLTDGLKEVSNPTRLT
jgi:predicted RNase H-like nuclease (RuvC/YqgF family)